MPDNKPMTPGELYDAIAANYLKGSQGYRERAVTIVTAYTESIRREAKLGLFIERLPDWSYGAFLGEKEASCIAIGQTEEEAWDNGMHRLIETYRNQGKLVEEKVREGRLAEAIEWEEHRSPLWKSRRLAELRAVPAAPEATREDRDRRFDALLKACKWAVYALEHGSSVEVHWLKTVANREHADAIDAIRAVEELRALPAAPEPAREDRDRRIDVLLEACKASLIEHIGSHEVMMLDPKMRGIKEPAIIEQLQNAINLLRAPGPAERAPDAEGKQ